MYRYPADSISPSERFFEFFDSSGPNDKGAPDPPGSFDAAALGILLAFSLGDDNGGVANSEGATGLDVTLATLDVAAPEVPPGTSDEIALADPGSLRVVASTDPDTLPGFLGTLELITNHFYHHHR